jgi:hypothetical protein
MVRSGGGGLHRWFQQPEAVTVVLSKNGMQGIPGLDVKGWHGLIVLPGSVHPETGKCYEFVLGKELTELHRLPVFNPAWVREMRREPLSMPCLGHRDSPVNDTIRDMRAYIRAIPSVQGQNGSRALMRVCYLLRDTGHDFHGALAELASWNEVCAFPPWSPKELIHGLTNAFKKKMQDRLAK